MSKLFKRKSGEPFNIKDFLNSNGLVLVVLLLIIYTSVKHPSFSSIQNLSNVLTNSSVRFIIALGVSGTLIIRGTDLSAGRIVGLSAVITGTLVQKPDFVGRYFENLPDFPIIVPLIIVMVVSAIIGAFNGIVIAVFKVPPFLATLGSQIMIFGITMIYSENKPIGTFTDKFLSLGRAKDPFFNAIPYLAIIAAIVGIIVWVLYAKTRYGKYMYAIGGNEEAAEVSGVNVAITKIKIYIVAGLLYGLAGYLLTAKTGSAGANAGGGYELEAIASATIGGVSTAGGEGTVLGILKGVFVFELLKTSLVFLSVSPEMTNVIQGLVIIVAVALDIRKTMERR